LDFGADAHDYHAPASDMREVLLPGERVVYRARLHWTVFAGPIIATILSVTFYLVVRYLVYRFALELGENAVTILNLLPFSLVGFLVLSAPYLVVRLIRYACTKFVVTNRRLFIRYGVFSRVSQELLLRDIRAVQVFQNIWGSILGYGT